MCLSFFPSFSVFWRLCRQGLLTIPKQRNAVITWEVMNMLHTYFLLLGLLTMENPYKMKQGHTNGMADTKASKNFVKN